ncbi:MAG: tyrosine-type recombinase/integrase, partial [Saprospiraceae bacterium]
SITSHRARSTIATQLYNAKEPMSLFELQQWLGHRSVKSTQYYASITPTKLAQAYSDAGYFGRNLRAVELLIDREAVMSGAAAREPWKFYDLGHGYCSYDFFDQCPHRMACAKCSFYIPKDSTRAQLMEGKSNLMRMRQEIPLNVAELAAVDDGMTALEKLLETLTDVPTPAGPTPRQMERSELVQIGGRKPEDGQGS